MDQLPPPDPERQRQAMALGRRRRRLFLAGVALDVAVPFLLWTSGASENFWRLWHEAIPGRWPALGAYGASLIVVGLLAALPLTWYGEHVLARRYGLSHQTLKGWAWDWVRGAGLNVAYSVGLILAFYVAVAYAGPSWWLVYWAFLAVVAVLVTAIAPVLLVPIFFRLRPVEDPLLLARVENLLRRAGTRVAAICTIDLSSRTVAGNAAVMGLGGSRRIVLGDTLLQRFSVDEVETVLAHELGHHVHRDLWRLLGARLGVLLAGLFLAGHVAGPLLALVGGAGLDHPPDLPLLLLGAQLFAYAALPALNAHSRARERAADQYAIALTKKPRAFLQALLRLEEQNLVEREPPRWASALLGTHPPMVERLAMAARAARAGGPA
jgi:STE24 endopeptidase